MRRTAILLATLAICGWAGPAWAAGEASREYYSGLAPGTVDSAHEAAFPVGDCCGCGMRDSAWGCGPCNGCGGRRGCLGGCRHRLAEKKADVGYFNCQCRGSYKFPVPPQYTYFWPGMYSQQTMTEYNDPYRFPRLKSPDEVFRREAEEPKPGDAAGPPAGPNGDLRSAEPNRLQNLDGSSSQPAGPATTSRIMKHLYGVP
jgi:hypothetical protein